MGGWSPNLRKGDVRDRIVQYAAELEDGMAALLVECDDDLSEMADRLAELLHDKPHVTRSEFTAYVAQTLQGIRNTPEAQQWRDLSATSRYEVLSVLGDPTRCSSVQMKAADVLASYCPDKELAEFRAWQARQGKP